MGLDMFLYGVKSNEDRTEGVWEEVCYWRKANHIHKWFSDRFIKDQNRFGYYVVSSRFTITIVAAKITKKN